MDDKEIKNLQEDNNKEEANDVIEFAALPLRDVVVYPSMVIPLFVGRDKSIVALNHAMKSSKEIILITQKKADQDDPSIDDLYAVGTLSRILQLLKLPDGTVKVLVEGIQRVKIKEIECRECFFVDFENNNLEDEDNREISILARALLSQFEQYLKLNKKIPPEILTTVTNIENNAKLSDTIAAHIPLKLSEKQKILEIPTLKVRFDYLLEVLQGEIDVLEVEKQVRSKVKSQMEKSQREYYLNEQMKAIQSELGGADNPGTELIEIETIESINLSNSEVFVKILGLILHPLTLA